MSDLSVLVFVTLPFVGLLIWSIIEIITRGDLDNGRRILWLAVVILLPVVGLAIYVVARPPKRAHESGGGPDTAKAEALVLLAERRQRGELTDAAYADEVGAAAKTD